MTARLSLTNKLLLVWAATIFASLVLLAFVFLLILSEYDEAKVKAQASSTQEAIAQQVRARIEAAKAHGAELAHRPSIINSVNLISTYQDKTRYDSDIFNTEKFVLTEEISEIGLNYDLVEILDNDREPIALRYRDQTGNIRSAISAYQDQKPFILNDQQQPFDAASIKYMEDAATIAARTTNTTLSLMDVDGKIVMNVSWPIIRTRPNNEENVVGYIVIRESLSDFVTGGTETTPSFFLSEKELERLLIQAHPTELGVGRELSGEFALEDKIWLETNDKYISIERATIPGAADNFFLVTLDKVALNPEFDAFKEAIFYVTLGMLVILLTLGSMLLRHSILTPIRNLLVRISQVSKGDYGEGLSVESKDEFGRLARSFENMAGKVKDRERRLADILRLAPEGIIAVNEKFEITIFNSSAETMFGYQADEVIGKPLDDLIPQRYRVSHRRHMKDFASSTTIQKNLRDRPHVMGLRKNGEEFPMSAAISQIDLGHETVYTVLVQDITQAKKNEAELISAKLEAEHASEAKSQFIASMSHDLRTPLNAIIGMSSMIKAEYFGRINEKYREYAGDVLASGEYLLTLINEILDMSAIETGQNDLHKEDLVVTDVVEECLRLVNKSAENKDISIKYLSHTDNARLFADKKSVQKVLLNLLTNSIKFSPPKSVVDIRTAEDEDHFSIIVQDRGIGIPPERIDDMMQPFSRHRHDSYLYAEGWGLGLAIAKSLMELHDGRINIKSVEGEGTIAEVWFPKNHPHGDTVAAK